FNALASPGVFDYRHLSAAGAEFVGTAVDALIERIRLRRAAATTDTRIARRYIGQDGNLILRTDVQSGVACLPVTADGLPAAVTIGESGALATLVCDDNTSITTTWRAEAGRNGHLDFVIRRVQRDALNQATESSTHIYTLNAQGAVTAFAKTWTAEPGGYSVSLASN
ncbi:MAG: hypothetical protein V2J12_00495, partial [Gammaproteobacteria bacterium]|nr:hypothetical protein [Gammaproteobacteria bacterium]